MNRATSARSATFRSCFCESPSNKGTASRTVVSCLIVALLVATAQAYPQDPRSRYAAGCRWDRIRSAAHGGRSGVSVQVRRGPQPLPLRLVLRQHGTLIRQDAIGDGLWLVESGALRVATISDAGHELVIDVLGPGHGAGEPSGVPSPVTVRALRPCRLSPVSGRA